MKIRFIILGFALFALSVPGLQFAQDSEEFWKPYFEQGFIFMQQGKLAEAEQEFQKILAKSDKIPEAHYGMGLIYNRKDPGSKEAEKSFKQAIKLNKDFALAYYQLAQVYRYKNELKDVRKNLQEALDKNPTLASAWLELVEVQEQLIIDNRSIVDIFARAFENVPNSRELSEKFVDACDWYDEEEKAIKVMRSLEKNQLNIPENLYQLARLEYLVGNFQESMEVLDTLRVKYPRFSAARYSLLLAKNYLGLNKPQEFNRAYEIALANIKTNQDASEFFEDLCYIMRNAEYDELQLLTADQLSDFYTRFWRSRDPNLATRENERIVEHYQRLNFARENYRRYTKNPARYENVYQNEHPYAIYNTQGTEMLKEAFFPKALPEVREFDDLGIIYIRHGEPDTKITSPKGVPDYVDQGQVEFDIQSREFFSEPKIFVDPGNDTTTFLPVESYGIPTRPVSTLRVPRPYMGETLFSQGYFRNMPMNVSWKYAQNYNRPEMVFHFKKYLGIMGWMIEAIPYTVADRELLSVQYFQLGQESFSAVPNQSFISELSSEIKDVNIKNAEIAMTEETADYKFEAEPLQFPMGLITFKFRNQNNLVELYYGLDGKQVELSNNGNGNFVEISKFVGLYDEKWNEVRWLNRDDSIPVNQTPEQWQQFAGVDVARFAVGPGKYYYEIQLKDKTSGRLGVYRGDLEVPDYWNKELQLSDILLSGAISPASEEQKFRKEDIAYTPHMFTDFKPNETVGIYFEVYNLNLNNTGESNFRITSTLQPATGSNSPAAKITGFFRSILGDEQGTVGTSYDYSGRDSDEKIYINFETGEINSGEYELVIETHDLNSDTKISKKVALTIS